MKVTHGQLVVARVGRFVWPLLVAGTIVALIIGWPPSTSNWITSGLIGISAILGSSTRQSLCGGFDAKTTKDPARVHRNDRVLS
jgi:hypothetical protein